MTSFAKSLFFALLLLVAVTACSEASAAADTVNQTCPMMGDAVTAEGGTVEWQGMTIGFCCEGCGPKFAALPEDEQKQKLAAAGVDLN